MLRAQLATMFAEAWGAAENAPAAEAWSAEARRLDVEAAQAVARVVAPTATVAREQTWLQRAPYAALACGVVGLLNILPRYPPLVVTDALTAPLTVAVAGTAGISWAALLWWRARTWNTNPNQLRLFLSLTGPLGLLSFVMASQTIALSLNVALDHSPVVVWRGEVLDLRPHDQRGDLSVSYADPRPGERGGERTQIFSGALARKLDGGAEVLLFHAHRGAFGIAWIERVTAE